MNRARIIFLASLGSLLLAPASSANLAPNPVQAGDVYVGAGLSVVTFKTDKFRFVRQFLDDDFSGTNQHTTTYDRGFLFSQKTSENRVYAAEVHAGYAFKEPLFDGALGRKTRLHFDAMAYQRSGGGLLPDGTFAGKDQPLYNPVSGMVESRGMLTHLQPLDGSRVLPNGDNATWVHGFDLTNAAVDFEETLGMGDMMIFFDEPSGPWRFTRGAGLTAGYEQSNWAYTFASPGIDAFAPGMAPSLWLYRFQMGSFYVGPRASFSIGLEPHRIMSLYIGGSFAPMLAVTSTDGTLMGPCLSACTINGNASTSGYGVSKLNKRDMHFAWDARAEAGASVYFRILRVTASVGVFGNNQFTAPTETKEDGFESQLLKQWGYFGRAVATIGF